MEAGVDFDGMIGVSAGACFGCNYKSHQPGRVIRYNKRFAHDPRYCSWTSLARTGDLFGAEFCYHTLPDELDPFDRDAFAADPMAFYVVTTDCSSLTVWVLKGVVLTPGNHPPAPGYISNILGGGS